MAGEVERTGRATTRGVSLRRTGSGPVPAPAGETGDAGREPGSSGGQPVENHSATGTHSMCTDFATVDTPHRFRTKRQFWSYSGLAVVTHMSSEYEIKEGRV